MDNRYIDTGVIDSPLVTDGDREIIGMDARIQPERLKPGYMQYMQNMRCDALRAAVRYGMAKQTNSITPTGNAPLFIPFTVGTAASSVISGGANDGIFTSCVFADPNNNNAVYIFMATAQKVYTFASSNSAVTTINYPANETIESIDPSTDMFQVGGQVYIVRGDLGTSFTVASVTATISSTTATVTTTTANGLSTNQYVRIGGANQAEFNGDFQITTTGVSAFTVTLGSAATVSSATGTITLNRLKTPMVWNGNFSSAFTLTSYGTIAQNFRYMPTSNWGLLQQNRVVLEYGRNSLIVSQINGPQAYDVINGVFTFAAGTNDYLVGVEPYQQTQLLVFMRRSVWLVNGLNGDVASMTSQLLTNQVGCISRHSIATCGANVLFLNSKGVFILQPGYELTLRGNSLPLSAPLDGYIQTINFAAADKPWAAYYLNRYYLAVPVNGSTRNNAMFVYNFINEAWESYDTFPNGFFCDELQVMMNASGVSTLYMIMYEGGLYAAEQNEQDDFSAAALPATQYLINGKMITRRFNFENNGLKHITRVNSVVNMDSSSTLSSTATLYNPNSTKSLATVSNTLGTSSQIVRPAMINKRAYAVDITYASTSGRFEILNYQIGAYVQDLKSTKN